MVQETTLRVLLNKDVDIPDYDYVLHNLDESLATKGHSTVPEMPIADTIVLVIPTNCITLTKVKLPPGIKFQSTKFDQMLPAAVEDQILSDINQVHVVADRMDEDGFYPVAVVDKLWLQAHVDRFLKLEKPIVAIVAAVLFGQMAPDTWEMTLSETESILKTAPSTVMWLDSGGKEPPVGLVLRLHQLDASLKPQTLLVRTNLPIDQSLWEEKLGVEVIAVDMPAQERWMVEKSLPSLNLAVKDFKPIRKKAGFDLNRYKVAAILFAVFLVIVGLDTTISLARDGYRKSRLQTGIAAAFKDAFPDVPMGNDPVLQMQEEIAKLRHRVGEPGMGDFLPMMSTLANALSKQKVYRVISIDYQQGVLTCYIGPIASGLDEIVDILQQQKYQVQTEVEDTGIKIEMRAGS